MVRYARLVPAGLLLVVGCSSGGNPLVGFAATVAGEGPVVVWDVFDEPLPDIPFPNDIATRPDLESPTGRRVNASLLATTSAGTRAAQAHRRARRLRHVPAVVDSVPVSRPRPARARTNRFSSGSCACNGPTPGSRTTRSWSSMSRRAAAPTVRPRCSTSGNGNFPIGVEDEGDYWDNDPRRCASNLVFDTYEEDVDGDGHFDVWEDTNQNGTLDDGEDIDGDGQARRPRGHRRRRRLRPPEPLGYGEGQPRRLRPMRPQRQPRLLRPDHVLRAREQHPVVPSRLSPRGTHNVRGRVDAQPGRRRRRRAGAVTVPVRPPPAADRRPAPTVRRRPPQPLRAHRRRRCLRLDLHHPERHRGTRRPARRDCTASGRSPTSPRSTRPWWTTWCRCRKRRGRGRLSIEPEPHRLGARSWSVPGDRHRRLRRRADSTCCRHLRRRPTTWSPATTSRPTSSMRAVACSTSTRLAEHSFSLLASSSFFYFTCP